MLGMLDTVSSGDDMGQTKGRARAWGRVSRHVSPKATRYAYDTSYSASGSLVLLSCSRLLHDAFACCLAPTRTMARTACHT